MIQPRGHTHLARHLHLLVLALKLHHGLLDLHRVHLLVRLLHHLHRNRQSEHSTRRHAPIMSPQQRGTGLINGVQHHADTG
jgi:hypothetical protein